MNDIDEQQRVRLAPGVRSQTDPATGDDVLLYPEGILILNETAREIVGRCDGKTTIAEIVAALAAEHQLGHLVHLEALVGHQPVQQLLDARVLGAERLLEPGAESLEIEEVEIEEPVEGRRVARFLDQRAAERRLEGASRPAAVRR